MTTLKKCSRCTILKTLDNFHFANKKRNILRPECKICRRDQIPVQLAPVPSAFSAEQHQLFVGSMLGDGNLSCPEKDSYNPYYAITRCLADRKYLEWHASKFSDFSKTECIKDGEYFDSRTGKTYFWSKFRTRSAHLFRDMRNKWYKNGVKIVPQDLILTPLAVAVWFCDDGCIYQTTSSFATDGFNFEEVSRLNSLLENLTKAEFSVRSHENKFTIRGNKTATQALLESISSHIPDSMMRKLQTCS